MDGSVDREGVDGLALVLAVHGRVRVERHSVGQPDPGQLRGQPVRLCGRRPAGRDGPDRALAGVCGVLLLGLVRGGDCDRCGGDDLPVHVVAAGSGEGSRLLHAGEHLLEGVVAKVRTIFRYVSGKAEVVGPETYRSVRRTVQNVSTAVEDAAKAGSHAAGAAFRAAASAGSRAYHAVTTYAANTVEADVHVVETAYHQVARAATATAEFVRHHEAAIASFAASTAVFVGCEAVTAGIGSVGCGAIAGAVGSAVSYGITAAQSGHFSWSGLGEPVAEGALEGAVGGEAGELLAGLGSGAADAASALADSASDEAVSGASDAAEDAATDAGGEGGDASGGHPSATGDAAGGSSGDGDAGNASNNDTANAGDDGDGPTCGGESFGAGTRVVLASGAMAAISSLTVGDKVLATNTKTGKATPETAPRSWSTTTPTSTT